MGELYRNSGRRNHFCRNLRRPRRGKAGVVAHEHPTLRLLILQYIRSNRARNASHVVERKIVSDDSAPSVGPEFNLLRHGQKNSSFPVSGPKFQVPRKPESRSEPCLETRSPKLSQLIHLLLVQIFHHFAHILSVLPSGDQQRIWSLDNHQIAYADECDKLLWSMNIIAAGMQQKKARTRDQIAFRRAALRRVMLVQRRPGTQIVPPKVRRQAENISRLLAFGGSRLQYRIVHADVLTLGILPSKSPGKLARTKGGRDFFEQTCGHRQVLPQRIGERSRTPQKHSAVPEIISCAHKLLGIVRVWLFREAAHA